MRDESFQRPHSRGKMMGESLDDNVEMNRSPSDFIPNVSMIPLTSDETNEFLPSNIKDYSREDARLAFVPEMALLRLNSKRESDYSRKQSEALRVPLHLRRLSDMLDTTVETQSERQMEVPQSRFIKSKSLPGTSSTKTNMGVQWLQQNVSVTVFKSRFANQIGLYYTLHWSNLEITDIKTGWETNKAWNLNSSPKGEAVVGYMHTRPLLGSIPTREKKCLLQNPR